MVEHIPEEDGVAGSNPALGTGKLQDNLEKYEYIVSRRSRIIGKKSDGLTDKTKT